MKRIVIAFCITVMGLHLAMAAESTLSASYTDNSLANAKNKTGEFTSQTVFKITERNLFGGSLEAQYVGGQRTGTAAGLVYEFGPTQGLIRPFAGAEAKYWFGQYHDVVNHEESVRAGLKLGGTLFIKGFVERVREHSSGGESNDATGVQIAFGLRYGK